MNDFWDWLRCRLFGVGCPWRPSDPDPITAKLRAHADFANRQADVLRQARLAGRRPTKRELWDEPSREAAIDDLWGAPPWRPGGGSR